MPCARPHHTWLHTTPATDVVIRTLLWSLPVLRNAEGVDTVDVDSTADLTRIPRARDFARGGDAVRAVGVPTEAFLPVLHAEEFCPWHARAIGRAHRRCEGCRYRLFSSRGPTHVGRFRECGCRTGVAVGRRKAFFSELAVRGVVILIIVLLACPPAPEGVFSYSSALRVLLDQFWQLAGACQVFGRYSLQADCSRAFQSAHTLFLLPWVRASCHGLLSHPCSNPSTSNLPVTRTRCWPCGTQY